MLVIVFVRLTELICCCLDVLDCYGVVVRVFWVVICVLCCYRVFKVIFVLLVCFEWLIEMVCCC